MFALRKINTIATKVGTLGASTIKQQKHTLPVLAYEYNALEPVISRDIMCLHHSQHHAAYVNNLNAAEEMLACAMSKGDVSKVVNLTQSLRFNGGGHINHTIFWQNLSPSGGKPSEKLVKNVEK